MLSSSSRRPLLLVTVAGLLVLGLLLWAALTATPARAATLTVTSAADSGPGSLRQAILDANASPGHDLIAFDIESGAQTITLTTALPVITDSLTLDGTTQDGFTGTLLIHLSGAQLPNTANGLVITAGNSTVRGLVLTSFPGTENWPTNDGAAILLRGGGGNTIRQNIMGRHADGTAPEHSNGYGVLVVNSSNNMIGGTGAQDGNNIYLSTGATTSLAGVEVRSGQGNAILGNLIISNQGEFGISFLSPAQDSVSDPFSILGGQPDLFDADQGPNGWQNFPLLYGAVNEGGVLTVTGVLKSAVSKTYRVELFTTSGPWQWDSQTFLGFVSVTTDADGFGSFSFTGPTIAPGTSVIATATDPHNNTSAFSFPLQSGRTFVVTNTADNGPGSLRQAILDANADEGSSLIRFQIGAGGTQIISPLSALPTLTSATVLDATTQPGYAGKPLIVLNGANAGQSHGLEIKTNNVIIRGLVINRFAGHGIASAQSDFNASPSLVMIQGNYIGTSANGMRAAGNGDEGITLTTTEEETLTEYIIGGTRPRERNVIGGNGGFGIHIQGASYRQSGLAIRGNYVGLNATGSGALGNRMVGISVGYMRMVLVGGQAPGAGNVVAGTKLPTTGEGAAQIVVEARRFWIQGNRIGTNAAGTGPIASAGWGLFAAGRFGLIGGARPAAANIIAYNPYDGIVMEEGIDTPLITIRGNTIFGNGRLGINLGEDGVTTNDTGDGDTGPNGLQNFPVLTGAKREGASLRVSGTLNSRPNQTYVVDLYASGAIDASGHGEGERYLGLVRVTTNASGNGTFSGLVRLPPSGQPWITATASHPNSGTSEFSRGLRAALE